MSIYLTDYTVVSVTIAGFTLVDIRLLPDKIQNDVHDITRAALLTVPRNLYCGGVEVEDIALRQAIESGEINPEDEDEFLEQYRAEANTRMSTEEFIGAGILSFGLFSGKDLVGAANIGRVSVLRRVGTEIQVRVTGSLFRRGVRVFNAARTRVTAQFTQDQANFFRGLLNTTFISKDTNITARVVLVDPHMKNSRYATLQATIDYDTALAAQMATFPEIVSLNANEGARVYKVYSHA